MSASRPSDPREIAPDQRKLTSRQAKRLAELAHIRDVKEVAGQSIATLAESLKWKIDPSLLFMRRICGRVVKKDPVTGVEHPVPFATVVVEDTDCNLAAYFPPGWPWVWFFPIFCQREEIATVTTDECGKFCVWIPRFDIDWILRWRKHRFCFPDIFIRPSIRDLIPPPTPNPPIPPLPRPGPDPGPFEELLALPPSVADALGGSAGRQLADRLTKLRAARAFGAPVPELDSVLDARAFDTEVPPPLPQEFQRALAGQADVAPLKHADPHEAIRSAVALHAGIHPRELQHFQPHRYIGPFIRCIDVWVPEWHIIADVPDITFTVKQDTNGDGVEEVIYGESYFDVRWNSGSIPDVTLYAWPNAKESHLCGTPVVPCGNVPALLFAGLMPLTNPVYFDSTTGYAKRPNRPIPPMTPRPDAETPFMGVLQLYGCVNVPGAQYYRVRASTDGGTSFSPLVVPPWNIYPIPFGPPLTITPDADGWYNVLPNPDAFHPARMVLEWPTPSLGKHTLEIEIGDAAKNPIGPPSATVAIQVDNTAPAVVFTRLAWKFASEPDSAFGLPGRDLRVPCPTIRRGVTPADIEVQADATVSAPHLRNASLSSSGCGGGAFALISPAQDASHWHTSVTDNAVSLSARFALSSSALEGAYGFHCVATSRAMNPAGFDGGHLADWLYDPVYVASSPQIPVAIVNA
jgi:hypothetical protein